MLRQALDSKHVLESVNMVNGECSGRFDEQHNMKVPNGADDSNNNMGFSYAQDLDGDNSCLVISISIDERKRMGKPFSKDLIIKLFGKSVGFKFLEKKSRSYGSARGILRLWISPLIIILSNFL